MCGVRVDRAGKKKQTSERTENESPERLVESNQRVNFISFIILYFIVDIQCVVCIYIY